MTAVDFAAAGGELARDGSGLRALLPKGSGLAIELRAEVARRVPTMHTMPAHGVYGTCDGCGDLMPPYRAGVCALCALARQKALRALGTVS